MLLTDPPVIEAYVYLYYTHSSNSFIVISTRRVIRHSSPLTLGLLVYCARRALGDVWMMEQVQGTRGPCLFARDKANTCIKTEAGKQIQRLGGTSILISRSQVLGSKVVSYLTLCKGRQWRRSVEMKRNRECSRANMHWSDVLMGMA